jgi:hypothetical protein
MLRSFGDHCCPRFIFSNAMYVIAGESKMVPLSGLVKSLHLLATSFTTSRVDGKSIREDRVTVDLWT